MVQNSAAFGIPYPVAIGQELLFKPKNLPQGDEGTAFKKKCAPFGMIE
jgi:hypothetical protein